MAAVWRAYLALLQKHPFRTQAVTSGALFCLSDLIAQEIVEGRRWAEYDGFRTARQTCFGFLFAGPSLFAWYRILDRVYPGTGKLVPLKKMVTDQIIFPPIFLTVYFSTVAISTGAKLKAVPARLIKDVPSIYMTGLKIWPAVQIVNFYYVPLYHRVLVVNIVALFWNTYLSWKAYATTKE